MKLIWSEKELVGRTGCQPSIHEQAPPEVEEEEGNFDVKKVGAFREGGGRRGGLHYFIASHPLLRAGRTVDPVSEP